jgi:hypothetical protein
MSFEACEPIEHAAPDDRHAMPAAGTVDARDLEAPHRRLARTAEQLGAARGCVEVREIHLVIHSPMVA